MVASGMAYIVGIKRNIIKNAVKEFKAVEHRIEYVANKNSDFTKLVKSFNKNIVYVVLYGQVREKIRKTLYENGYNDYSVVETMDEALDEAIKHSKEGMNILLSPACASFDQYKNYEERRRSF